jgi:hypothetical protein
MVLALFPLMAQTPASFEVASIKPHPEPIAISNDPRPTARA